MGLLIKSCPLCTAQKLHLLIHPQPPWTGDHCQQHHHATTHSTSLATRRTHRSAPRNFGSPISTTHQAPKLPKSTSRAGLAQFLSVQGDSVGQSCEHGLLSQPDLRTKRLCHFLVDDVGKLLKFSLSVLCFKMGIIIVILTLKFSVRNK